MIELVDTIPDINVQPAEFKRLLGFPRERVIDGRARELAEWARGWYAEHGRPWVYARQVQSLRINNGSILIDEVPFTSTRLAKTLVAAEADGAVLAVVSAGPQIEAEAQKLWLEEKPDEYFFLEVFGSAVVEHLVTMTGARLCAWAEARGMAVLPHYSPGYDEWDVAQQPRLLDLIKQTRQQSLPWQVESFESGMLRPKKSLLAVFPLTRHTERVRRLTALVPCENCSFGPCQYRRAPYVAGGGLAEVDASAPTDQTAEKSEPAVAPLDLAAKYSINLKALRRWAGERLTLTDGDDGNVNAVFRYDGTTCANTGREFTFIYQVKLGPRAEGYPIRAQQCGPAPGDDGHRYMCRYMTNSEHLMVAIDHEKPLLGHRLDDVLTWQRPTIGPGCHCEPPSRKHKWGLVLETIHFALAQLERKAE